MAALQRRLAEHGQFLAIDPPLPDRATIGGTLAVGGSGPAKWQFGNPRDTVIGMKVAQADGTFVRSGGQVVKNVSGYDMARLHVGGLGTLGVIAEVSFKLTPLPRGEATLVAAFDSRQRCFEAGLAIFHSDVIPLALTAYDAAADSKVDVAQVKGAHLLAVRLGGRPRTLQRSLHECRSLCHVNGATAVESLDDAGAVSAWRKLADFGWDDTTTPLMLARASALPTALAGLVEAVAVRAASQDAHFASVCHLGYGTALLCWFASGQSPAVGALAGLVERAREAVHAASSRMTVQRCPPEAKSTFDVWDEVEPDDRRSPEMMACYLVEGSFDRALDILDRETAKGRLIDVWYLWGKWHWWKQLEENPRYIALMNRIEVLLAEQRELLSEMDKSGNLVP